MIRNPSPESFRDVVRQRADAAGRTRQDAADAIGVSRQTLYDWIDSGDLRISQLRGLAKGSGEAIVLRFDPDPDDTTNQAPRPEWAEGLVDEFLDRWAVADAPKWAEELTRQIVSAIEKDRQVFLDQAAAHYAEIARLLHRQDNDDGGSTGTSGSSPKQPGPTIGP